MKLKYYLRGLGVGIILTVIILMIASSGEKSTMTDKEIIERAQALGMVMAENEPEEKEAENTPSTEPEEKEEEDTPSTESEEKEEEDTPSTEPEEKEEEDTPSTEPEEKEEEDTPSTTQEEEPIYTMIEIIGGEYSDKISTKLYEAGLVPDAEEFNRYLVESGIDGKIAVGQHQIPQGATIEEIAAILCEKPVNE